MWNQSFDLCSPIATSDDATPVASMGARKDGQLGNLLKAPKLLDTSTESWQQSVTSAFARLWSASSSRSSSRVALGCKDVKDWEPRHLRYCHGWHAWRLGLVLEKSTSCPSTLLIRGLLWHILMPMETTLCQQGCSWIGEEICNHVAYSRMKKTLFIQRD